MENRKRMSVEEWAKPASLPAECEPMNRILLIAILSVFAICSHGQSYEDSTCENSTGNNFLILSNTNDQLYWENECYLMNRFPLSFFPGYDSLYCSVPTVDCIYWLTIGDHSLASEKNYSIDWMLIDSVLYLGRINFYAIGTDQKAKGYFPFNEQYKKMEKLTGIRFASQSGLFTRPLQIGPLGIMPATWFTGTLYVQKIKDRNEPLDDWTKKSFWRILFRRGKLVAVDEIDRQNKNKDEKITIKMSK